MLARKRTGRHTIGIAVLAAVAMGAAALAQGAPLSGAGATFPYPVYAQWAAAYREQKGVAVNYQSIGSGAGIRQVQAGTVTFGASDMPLSPAKLQQSGLIQWPMIIGGAIPVVNVPGVTPGQLRLDGPTLAAIYLGRITRWNDPALRRLNPTLRLPAMDIAPIYRADGSGTNFLFTDYLSKASPLFAKVVGEGTSVQWPLGLGAKGNEGIANQVIETYGSIGYVEYAYVVQTHMVYAQLRNRAGNFVAPSIRGFQSAAASADWAASAAMNVLLTDQPGADAWPITGASFILMRLNSRDANTASALAFFDWAYRHGQSIAQQLDYVPIPPAVVRLVESRWQHLRVDGKPVWPRSP